MAKDQTQEPQIGENAERDLQMIIDAAVEEGKKATATELRNQLQALMEKSDVVATITETTKTSALKAILRFIFGKKDKGTKDKDADENGTTSDTTEKETTVEEGEKIITDFINKYQTLESAYNECIAKLNTSLEENKALQESLTQLGINVKPDTHSEEIFWSFLGNVNPNSTTSLSFALNTAKAKIIEKGEEIKSLKATIKTLESTIQGLEGTIKTEEKSASAKFKKEINELTRKIKLLTDTSTEQENAIADQESTIADLEKQLQSLRVRIQEKDAIISQLHNAPSGIVKIKEELLEEAQRFAARIQEAVEEVRTVDKGETLAAYFTFETNEEITDECLVICNQLKPNILGNISMYSTTIQAYSKLLEEIANNNKTPSLSLLKKSIEILGKLKALKELQDQLIADTVNEQAGDNQTQEEAESAEEDYYKILGLDPSATQEEIIKAYRKLAIELHPDTNGGDKEKTERFIKVKEAYETLSDTEKRRVYDDLRSQRQSKAA